MEVDRAVVEAGGTGVGWRVVADAGGFEQAPWIPGEVGEPSKPAVEHLSVDERPPQLGQLVAVAGDPTQGLGEVPWQ